MSKFHIDIGWVPTTGQALYILSLCPATLGHQNDKVNNVSATSTAVRGNFCN